MVRGVAAWVDASFGWSRGVCVNGYHKQITTYEFPWRWRNSWALSLPFNYSRLAIYRACQQAAECTADLMLFFTVTLSS